MEIRSLRQARAGVIAMDPAIEAFLERLESTLVAHTVTLNASKAKVDDLVAWRPDLERCVADLGGTVAALQNTHQPPTQAGEAG
ncbi:hypothetical protein D1007_08848 [Hordeum vulgare]|nr:hypothetical protein D1007_08848 [Hordeum vulgare]